MQRKIMTSTWAGSTVEVPADVEPRAWLAEQAREHELRWLLAHADNGVIWGELRVDGLHLSSDAFGPDELRLDWETLQQARLFGAAGELRLWKGPAGWQAYRLRDGAGQSVEYLDEEHLLWGTRAVEERDGFTAVVEGSQGILHAPPIRSAPIKETKHEARARLKVRHYIHEDEAGVAQIVESRLVALLAPGEH